MKTVHTMLPGIIEEFDAITQTAKVNLVHSQRLVDGTELNFPPLINVPVQFYRWGAFSITAPVATDDPCAVFFCERSMDKYLELGAIGKPPNDKRFFDLSDGFAVPGLVPSTKVLSDFNEDELEIRSDNGNTKFRITDSGKIQIINGSGELISTISDILNQLQVESVTVTSGSSAGTYPVNGQAVYAALKLILDTFKV
jgi:hypothetical protein